MIKLTKQEQVPEGLAPERVLQAIRKIESIIQSGGELRSADFDDTIYKHESVITALSHDQNCKCAYCEVDIAGGRDVEHYRPKTAVKTENGETILGYYWLAYEWKNLLYSCKTCNNPSNKGNYFPLSDPDSRDIANKDISNEDPLLINPYEVDPAEHICFRQHIACPVVIDGVPSVKGQTTIDLLNLNARPGSKPARNDLKELRLRTWKNVETAYKRYLQNHTEEEARQYVLEAFGTDFSPFRGMIRNQTMWPTKQQ